MAPPQADINETVDKVAVEVSMIDGKVRAGDITVTHFRPSGDGPFPIVVLQHGRASARRSAPWRWRLLPLARFFVRRGFAVLVPTRLGYGESGLTPDPERVGTCAAPNLAPMIGVLVAQTEAVLDFARRQPWADANRALVAGQSLGGLTAVASAGRRLPGVVAAINFSGGAAGRSDRPLEPCAPAIVRESFRELGRNAKVPTLWLYAENDRLWGNTIPRDWHRSYAAAGAPAEFHMLPAVGDDGHDFTVAGFRVWRPLVDAFLAKLGFAVPRTPGAPPPSGFAAVDDASKVPFVREAVRHDQYQKFLDADLPRAFVISRNGSWVWATGADALERALGRCGLTAKSHCSAYAVDDAVVWVPK
jgi:dienelactone hydrolase